MMVNVQEPLKNQCSDLKPCKTPLKQVKKKPFQTHSHNSSSKYKKGLNSQLDMNKKYERKLTNRQFFKLRQVQKYPPRRLSRIQPEKPFVNLKPIQIKKVNSSKEGLLDRINNQESLRFLQVQQKFTLFGRRCTQKRIVQNQSSLPQIPQAQITISKIVEDSWLRNPDGPSSGFWIPHNKIISLFPVNNRKIDKVPVINQPFILPMLGCLTIKRQDKKSQKYIVTQLFKRNTLRDIINQFGTLDEPTAKVYLRKVIPSVWNLHKNRISHNRLTMDAFICAQNGDVLLNMLKSSAKPPTQRQKSHQTHHFPPQILLSRTNYDSVKNDIWGIGCIALELLTGLDIRISAYHPYNQRIESDQINSPKKYSTAQIPRKDKTSRFLSSFQLSRISTQFNLMKDSLDILQKVKRLIQKQTPSISQSLVCVDLCESIILKQISPLAADFIKRCLNLKLQKRPSIDQLMFHSFLK